MSILKIQKELGDRETNIVYVRSAFRPIFMYPKNKLHHSKRQLLGLSRTQICKLLNGGQKSEVPNFTVERYENGDSKYGMFGIVRPFMNSEYRILVVRQQQCYQYRSLSNSKFQIGYEIMLSSPLSYLFEWKVETIQEAVDRIALLCDLIRKYEPAECNLPSERELQYLDGLDLMFRCCSSRCESDTETPGEYYYDGPECVCIRR